MQLEPTEASELLRDPVNATRQDTEPLSTSQHNS